jgi:hypothetical protein
MTPGLRLIHEYGSSLRVFHSGQRLFCYVYEPVEPRLESPRPYFHPMWTLGGDEVSLYRPHDHVWHKGLAWSLPNVGEANFWGGPTYIRGRGYTQLRNNGTMRHQGFDALEASAERVRVAHRLAWVTEQDHTWFVERRSFTVTAQPEARAWTMVFTTSLRNVSDGEIVIGSPTTQGRENAGYGGLFWRGPRSFAGGRVETPDAAGGDELMGVRASWMAYTGSHDGHGRRSTLLIVDAPENPGHPTQWFVRTQPFACLGSAPFFSAELAAAPGEELTRRYAVVVAETDPDAGPHAAAVLADLGVSALEQG